MCAAYLQNIPPSHLQLAEVLATTERGLQSLRSCFTWDGGREQRRSVEVGEVHLASEVGTGDEELTVNRKLAFPLGCGGCTDPLQVRGRLLAGVC